jgi:hypothetical protein
MRRLLIFLSSLAVASVAFAQTSTVIVGQGSTGQRVQVKATDDGRLLVSGDGSSGGGGASDGVAQNSTTAAQNGVLMQGAVTTAAPTYTTAKTNPISIDTAGNLRTLAAQGGTWNITNISGTISLPTGAATLTGQNTTNAALGAPADAAWTSGSGSITALLKTIAGAAADTTTASPVNNNCFVVTADQSYTASTNSAMTCTTSGRLRVGLSSAGNIAPGAPPASQSAADLVACRYTTANPTFADANTGALTCDSSGNLRVTTGSAALGATDLTEARINVSASGDTALVSATASQVTRVYRMMFMCSGVADVQIKDGSTVLQQFRCAADGQGVVLDFSARPWFTTTANTALNINLSASIGVQGRIYYIKG